jgi:hypothetical protein
MPKSSPDASIKAGAFEVRGIQAPFLLFEDDKKMMKNGVIGS